MCSASLLLKASPIEVSKGRKPHTKLQQKCIDLANTLPPLTDAQKKWARSKMSGLGFYVTRGRGGKHSCIWCQECGQMDEVGLPPLAVALKIKDSKTHVCSKCGRKLEVRDWAPRWDHKHYVEHDFNFAIVTVCEGMQVVRMFNWHQYNTLGSETINHVFEVFQVWFEPIKGKKVIISKQYTRSFYHFRWHMHSEWKVKSNAPTGDYYYKDIYSLDNIFIYPRAKILPILRRNGWSNEMFSMYTSPLDIWHGLLTDPTIEGLAKTHQYDVMDYWFRHGGPRRDKSQWLSLVKICNRRKYIIKDASMWFDYIDLLEYFHKDTHSPHYICPENLKREHDNLMDKKTRIEKAAELKRQIAQAEKHEKDYKKHRGMFFGICFGNENIVVTVISSVKEMAEEGTMMHHCVYANGYYDHKSHPYSLILSAKDKDGHRLETVEVSTKTWQVLQSRAVCNGTSKYHDEIVKLVEQNIGLFKKAAA